VKVLYIDFSNSSEIKILNTRTKKSLEIISAYYIPVFEETDAIETAAQKLKDEKLLGIPAIIIPPRSITNYNTFSFPSIPEKELRKVLPREIQKHTDSTDEIIFDFKIGSTFIKKNENKLDVITYFMTKKDIWTLLEALKTNGIIPIKIVPEVQSIESFIKNSFLPQIKDSTNGIVVIDMMANKINMNIFNKNSWSLNREFPFKVESSASIDDKDFSRISTEFSRTFQYFKQKNKSVSIDEAIIYGSNESIEVLADFINENQPLNPNLINNIKTNCEIIFPPNLENKNEFLSIFFITIATANSIIRKDFIDLYPKEFIEKEKLPKQILIFSLIGLAVFIILAVLTTFSLTQKNEYKDELKKIEKEFNFLQSQIDQIKEIRIKRKDYYEKIIIMEKPQKVSFQITDFIRKLSLIINLELPIEITKLNIIPKENEISFTLNGKLFSDSINGSLTTFDTFLKKIKALQGIQINNFTSPSSATVLKEDKNLFWNFNISGSKEFIRE